MEGWHAPAERSAGGDGTGPWLKLANDGDVAVVVFLGDPYSREVVFDSGRQVPFGREHAQQGLEPKMRYAINVAVLATTIAGIKTPEVKVLEMSGALYRDVYALRTKYGVADWAFEIQRHGKPKDPKTIYRVLPERQLTHDEKAWMARAPLTNLRSLYQDRGAGGDAGGDSGRELAQHVGRLDRDGQQRFFARFGIRTLSELEPVLVPKALEYLRDQPVSRAAGSEVEAPATETGRATLLIGSELASQIVVDLKKLPQEAVQDWLKHCGIQRVRDLPVDRVPDARAFLALLMKEFGPATTAAVDPYS
ncbi:MAG: hypothetical protein HS111_09870 [Kofleriaceae bacterium]|nr:hypothetical protein [Kofleriaceae bacterium]